MTSQYANWQIMTIVGLTVLVSILLITLFSMARHVKRLRLRLRHSAEVLVPSNTAPIIIASQRRTWNCTNWSELNWYSVIWEPKGQVKGLPMVAISDCDLYFKTKNECALRDFSKIIAYAENCQKTPPPSSGHLNLQHKTWQGLLWLNDGEKIKKTSFAAYSYIYCSSIYV